MQGYLKFSEYVGLFECGSVVGKKEKEGPIGEKFDLSDLSDLFGKETWEDAESEMQRLAFNVASGKAGLSFEDIDIVFSGDLMNQCVGGSYSFSDVPISYAGIYGACSTFPLGIIMSSVMISGGFAKRCAAVTSSHYCSAERQFRTPLEYGSQRTPTAQWTVTGAAAAILSSEDKSNVKVHDAYIGKIIDMGINDPANMGAAMAPAAMNTIVSYLEASGSKISDFDGIFTGDLGMEGKSILKDLVSAEGIVLGERYNDCGCMIYDIEKQDVHSGGSGCASSGCVFSAHVFDLMKSGKLKNVLLIGTGALMSPQFLMQGKSIPAVAHLVNFRSEE